MSQFFKRNNEDMLTKHAKDLICAGKARYVIMGHTHEVIEDHKTGYYNPGCLTRRFSLGYSEKIAKWDYLKKEQLNKFPFNLQYVEIDSSANPHINVKNYCNH
jgi:predicted phosphodiesterase